VSIQTYRPGIFVFVEQVLSEMQYDNVPVMRNFCEYVCYHLIDARHVIIYHNHSLKAHFHQTLLHLAMVDLPQNVIMYFLAATLVG